MLAAQYPTARRHAVAIVLRTNSASNQWLAPPDQTAQANYAAGTASVRGSYNSQLAKLVSSGKLTSMVDLVPGYYQDAANPDVSYSDGATNRLTTNDGAHFTANGAMRVGGDASLLKAHMAANVVAA